MTRKENYLRAIFRQSPQWVPYHDEALITVRPPVCERPDETGKDAFGCLWLYEPYGGTYPAQHSFVISDISCWREQVTFPDVEQCDWSKAREQAAAIDRSEYLVGGFIEMGIFERIYLLMGMEEALMAYYTDEDSLCELADAIADYKIQFLKKYHAEVGIDILWYGDDWGTQQNLFIPPEKWRKVIKPYTQKIYDCAKELGIIINQHSCGKVDSILGDMVEMGAQVWNPCQPCNNLAQLKVLYGDRICFCGGVDSQFVLDNPLANADNVVEEVKKRIREMALPNGGYLVGPSHTVPYNPEKLEAMQKTISEYGRAIYRDGI